MSETKNVVIQQNNGTDYNILYPDSNSWKKDQVAILETFQKYGLDANAVPKNLFDYLIGQIKSEYGKTYLWNKWKWAFTPEENANGQIYSKTISRSYTGNLYIAQFSSVQVHKNGNYTGTLNQILTVKKYDDLPHSYYYSDIFKTEAEARMAPPVCYGGINTQEGGGNRGRIGSDGNYLYVAMVSVLADCTVKTDKSIVSSTNQNAYVVSDLPDSEGYFYESVGFNANPVLGQVYNSYYIGTGDVGKTNPTTITCTGTPLFVAICEKDKENNKYDLILIRSVSLTSYYPENNYSYVTVTWTDNSVSFYNNRNLADAQFNLKNVRYDFVVIQTI